VKAKSVDPSNPEIEGQRTPLKAEFLPYLQDVAFQKYVLSKAYPQSTVTSYLLLTDKTSVVSVSGLNQLFKIQKINVLISNTKKRFQDLNKIAFNIIR
jgi:hypothetical protein